MDKARTSAIMNQKADVPTALRSALSIVGIREKMMDGMASFAADYLDSHRYRELSEHFADFIYEDGIAISFENSQIATLLTDLLLQSISESNRVMPEIILVWKHGQNTIDVQSGDLFRFGFDNRHKKKNIVVIPVNTAFDTHVTRGFENETYPLVSENTIHGQWLTRLQESGENLNNIDQRIAESLRKTGFRPVKESKAENGKRICYPIGSVAIIETKNAAYFLSAMAEFDDFNNAQSSSNDIDSAIGSLLNVYDRFGLGYDLYLPLMGTGLSRAGLSIQEAYSLLIESLMKNKDKIHGHVHLILRPTDRDEIILKED